MSDPFNCPKCGAHDYGIYRATLQPCPHCQQVEIERLTRELGCICTPESTRADCPAHARYCSHGHLIGQHECGETTGVKWDVWAHGEIEHLRSRLAEVVGIVQRTLQPAGSPPPGGEEILIRWICDSANARLAEVERQCDTMREALCLLLPGLVLDLRYADQDDDKDAMRSRIRTVVDALKAAEVPDSATPPETVSAGHKEK